MRTGVKGQGKSKEKVRGMARRSVRGGLVMDEGNSDERVRKECGEGEWMGEMRTWV